MRKVDQRFWDAMIIKAWNDFDTCDNLMARCHAEFGDLPYNLPLIRNKEMFGGVRSWVDLQLHSLSEKLWTLPKNRQVELLDWLSNNKLDCERYKKAARHRAQARSASNRATNAYKAFRLNSEIAGFMNSRMEQMNVVKPVRNKR